MKVCGLCRSSIHAEAKVCPICQRAQSIFHRLIGAVIIPSLALLVAFASLLFSNLDNLSDAFFGKKPEIVLATKFDFGEQLDVNPEQIQLQIDVVNEGRASASIELVRCRSFQQTWVWDHTISKRVPSGFMWNFIANYHPAAGRLLRPASSATVDFELGSVRLDFKRDLNVEDADPELLAQLEGRLAPWGSTRSQDNYAGCHLIFKSSDQTETIQMQEVEYWLAIQPWIEDQKKATMERLQVK